jgi:ABC-type transporter lipoprotein component MlaA
VNTETEEGLVELYLKPMCIFPLHNIFKFVVPKTLLISRKEKMVDLVKKVQRLLNNYLYSKGEKGMMVSQLRVWKHMTN